MATKKNTIGEGIGVMPVYEPPTVIKVSKDQAGSVSIGEKITVNVYGTVKRVGECYDGKSYEIELKGSKVTGIDANTADKELKRMID